MGHQKSLGRYVQGIFTYSLFTFRISQNYYIIGDTMHKEYKHIVDGADTAVLFIHGIIGTPNHFKDFIPLVPKEYSIHNLLLDGHGKGVKDFSRTSMRCWKKQVNNAVDDLLKSHNQIIIVAHSMGTLFALQESVRNPQKIKSLFLLATPLKLGLKLKMFTNSIKVFFDKIKPDDAEALAAKAAYGIENDKRIWRYFGWIFRYLELFKEIKYTRKIINSVSVNCAVFQSRNDEMVSHIAALYLKDNPHINIKFLENSSHYFYNKNDYQFLLNEFEIFCKNKAIYIDKNI